MQKLFLMRLSVLIAASLLFPVAGYCASKPVSPIMMPYGDATEAMGTPAVPVAAASEAPSRVIEGKVIKTVFGAHDTEGDLEIMPISGSDKSLAGMDVHVPNNTSIQRTEEVEKASGEKGVAFFRHIHVGDTVSIAFDQEKDQTTLAVQYVAARIDILHRG